MNFKLKVMAIVLLLVITFFSITVVDGATKVTIEGIGTATAERDNNGVTTWECKPTSQNKCTITIVFQQ